MTPLVDRTRPFILRIVRASLHFLSVNGKSALIGGTDSGGVTRFGTSPLTNLPLSA
jgi:hypothetical protein